MSRVARAWSIALVGMEATPVEVEASIGGGLPRTVMVGLPDAALYEARDRCKAATASAGFEWPTTLLTINLSPATLPKTGSHYDMAVVAAVLGAAGQLRQSSLEGTTLLGELGLNGRVRPVRGVLPALLAAVAAGHQRAIVPLSQLREARLVDGIEVRGVSHLREVVGLLRGQEVELDPLPPRGESEPVQVKDLVDVVGQLEARWALEVAAAGGHHLYLHGQPGVGKTLLAERLPGILPDLTLEQSLEVSAIHSLAGFSLEDGLVVRPPYADPHHSASVASLVGGGARIAQPGAISRAHRGVLFLDEAPEFSPRALEALRTPLESGRIVLARSMAQTTYPARFLLVLAANPCPCGQATKEGTMCRCTPNQVRQYSRKVSGPILDRIDITCHLRPMRVSYLRSVGGSGEPSSAVAERVAEARDRQLHRLAATGHDTNASVPGPVLRRRLPLPDGTEALDRAVSRGTLSARGVDKCLRVAWTIADLAGRGRPTADDLNTALAMRQGDEHEVRCG